MEMNCGGEEQKNNGVQGTEDRPGIGPLIPIVVDTLVPSKSIIAGAHMPSKPLIVGAGAAVAGVAAAGIAESVKRQKSVSDKKGGNFPDIALDR